MVREAPWTTTWAFVLGGEVGRLMDGTLPSAPWPPTVRGLLLRPARPRAAGKAIPKGLHIFGAEAVRPADPFRR